MKQKKENKREEKRKEKKNKKTSCIYFYVFVWFSLFISLLYFSGKNIHLTNCLELVNSAENPSASSNIPGTF